MSFQIKLMRCTAERERVDKSGYIISSWACDGELKEVTSILNPTIVIKKSTPIPVSKYNYMFINQFKRYYFIDEIVSLYDNMWSLQGKCDVLFSHKTDILNSKCIIDKTEDLSKANLYFDDGSFVMDSRKYNRVIKFPSGLPQNGYNILICAGGV